MQHLLVCSIHGYLRTGSYVREKHCWPRQEYQYCQAPSSRGLKHTDYPEHVDEKHQFTKQAYEFVARFLPDIPRLNVTKLLHGFAKGEGTATQKTVLATIHQPSEEVFNLFDKAWGDRFWKHFVTTLTQGHKVVFLFQKKIITFTSDLLNLCQNFHFGGPDSGGRSHSLLWFTFRGFASLHFVGIALSS